MGGRLAELGFGLPAPMAPPPGVEVRLVGVAELPFDVPVEVEAIVELAG